LIFVYCIRYRSNSILLLVNFHFSTNIYGKDHHLISKINWLQMRGFIFLGFLSCFIPWCVCFFVPMSRYSITLFYNTFWNQGMWCSSFAHFAQDWLGYSGSFVVLY
jgi:hypothetical protein